MAQVTAINGNVTLTAQHSILASSATSLIKGNSLALTAQKGSLGTLGSGGSAAEPAGGALAIRLITGPNRTDTLLANAQGDVFVKAISGNLYLNQVKTPGNARIEVASGSLFDGNAIEARDPRTWAELKQLYDSMLATKATAIRN